MKDLYNDIVNQAQMNYARFQPVYRTGGAPYELSDKKQAPYAEQIRTFADEVREADVIIVGGASGLSAAGGGDFYYEDNGSYRRYFGKYADKYGFKGAFDGMMHPWETREEFWGYLATFLNTTLSAEIRAPYHDLDAILKGKEFFVITTNQDTQFVKIYDESKVSELQGDHRFFQCSRQCCDDTWDATEHVSKMIEAMGEGRSIPTELIPRCPHCGAEAFPWVRGYGNFLQGTKYYEEYQKASDFIAEHANKKILFIELGVGRLTPMFIQEPFWMLTQALPQAKYIAVNAEYDLLPKEIEDKGMVITGNIAQVLEDVRQEMEASEERKAIA